MNVLIIVFGVVPIVVNGVTLEGSADSFVRYPKW